MSRRRTVVAGLLVCGASLPVAPASAARLSLGSRDLRPGTHGTDVRVLQDFLSRVGIRTSVDGQYGPTTTRHVRSWERKSSLRADGAMPRKNIAILRSQVTKGDSALQGTGGATQPVAAAPAPMAAPVVAATSKATLGADGLAVAPADAPPAVQQVIAAANAIVGQPYRYGGGHASFTSSGYDCSGSESYALHGANLVTRPLDSTEFESFGDAGPGTWITSYANSGHSYLVVAGLRFDTGFHPGPSGPAWSAQMRPADGYVVRHPTGL